MRQPITRRAFVASAAAGAAGLAWPRYRLAAASWPKAADHTLTVVTGKPRERGRQYGNQFGSAIAKFLDQEIVTPFSRKVARDVMFNNR